MYGIIFVSTIDLLKYSLEQLNQSAHFYNVSQSSDKFTVANNLSKYFMKKGYYKNKPENVQKGYFPNGNNFEIVNFKGETFYHGSFFKVDHSLYTPTYYSKDILQSVGHVLIEFRKLQDAYNNQYRTLKKSLSNVAKCFPLLYEFKTAKNISLLKINKPYDYESSFDKLFEKDLLIKYVMESQNAPEIINEFKSKLKGIGMQNVDTLDFNSLIDKYLKNCKEGCFGGWVNTPGYYLLSKINYNNYFRENLGVETDVIGLYIESDQDEIVLFDNSNIGLESINYILPYSYINADITDVKSFISNYVAGYKEWSGVLNSIYNDNNIKMFKDFIKIISQYNYIDIDNQIPWGFNWYKTACNPYDPLKDINKQDNRLNTCALRQPIYSDYPEYDWSLFDNYSKCQKEWKSSKISIDDMGYVQNLLEYLNKIKSGDWSVKNINISDLCISTSTISDTTRQLL